MTDTANEVFGQFASLKAGEGYFATQSTLSEEIATDALAFADERVDTLFARWDRTAWTGENCPQSIKRNATKLAVGEYLEMVMAVGNPEATEAQLATRLKREAERDLKTIVEAGGPVVDGEQLAPEPEPGSGNRPISRRAVPIRWT